MFEHTEEQKAIFEASRKHPRLSINAFAGCTKSTTQYGIAKHTPRREYLLLVFSKALQVEAEKTLAKEGIKNVTAKTTHSLAYGPIVFGNKYKVRNQDYKAYDITSIYRKKKISQYNAFLALKLLNKYFNSDDKSYTITLKKYSGLDKNITLKVVNIANDILKDMRNKKIDCTHSFYLKEFQLMVVNEGYNIKKYDGVFLDEAQDTNIVTQSIFDNISAKYKVKVGDEYQGIFGWRDTVNIMQNVEGWKTMSLTKSFRLPEEVAKHADRFLKVFRNEANTLKGVEKDPDLVPTTRATITRSNSRLIKYMDILAREGKTFKTVRHPNEMFSNIMDLSNLLSKKHENIKNKSLLQLEKEYEKYNAEEIEMGKDKASLLSYIEREMKEIDRDIYSAGKQIVTFGSPRIFELKKLAMKYWEDKNLKPDMYLSTGHMSKGLEWDSVTLGDDFPNIFKLAYDVWRKKWKLKQEVTHDNYIEALEEYDNSDLLFDEMNLFYVAATRSKLELKIEEKNSVYLKNYTKDTLVQVLNKYRLAELKERS